MKYIKIIIVILIIIAIAFGFIIINNNNNNNNKVIDNNTVDISSETNNKDRVNFNTNNNTNNGGEINNNSSSSTSTKTNTDYIDTVIGSEEKILQNIEKNLFNWELTKDTNFLKEALKSTENVDNEAIMDQWSMFMSKNSSELIKIIDSSTDIKKTSTVVYSIFDWYINFNSEYEKLSNTKKQEINRQYTQLKSSLKIK